MTDVPASPFSGIDTVPGPRLLTDSSGTRVTGAALDFPRSLRYVFERERPGSWAAIMKSTGRAGGRQLAMRGMAGTGSAPPLGRCLEELRSHFLEYGWGLLSFDVSAAAEHGVVVAHLASSYFSDPDASDLAPAMPLPAGFLLGYFEQVTDQPLAAEEIGIAAGPERATAILISTSEQVARIAPFIGRESAEAILARLRG